MSYMHYSEDAVKEIMLKVRESHSNGYEREPEELSDLSIDDLFRPKNENRFEDDKTNRAISEYDHPTEDMNPEYEKTHILLDRFFETALNSDEIWKKILNGLNQNFHIETSAEVLTEPNKRKWVHLSHSNLETIATLTLKNRRAKLTLSQRVGFWSSKIEGLLHGAYISLLLFGFTFATLQPSPAQSISIFLTLWILSGLIVFGFNKAVRQKKRRFLNKLANNIIEGLPR